MELDNNKFRIEQEFKYEGDEWWSWSIWIDGSESDLDAITSVTYVLHPTFRNPVRVTTDRASNFRLDTDGWGTFNIKCKILLDNKKEIHLEHELFLEYPDGMTNME